MGAPKGNKYAKGNKGGRPTKATPDVIAKAKAYLKQCKDKKNSINLPGVAGLSRWLNISRETVRLWAKEDKVFFGIYEEVMAEQEKRLTEKGLAGTYNPTITKLLLTKHGYSDRQELTGKEGGPMETSLSFENDEAKQKASKLIKSYLGNRETDRE